MRAALLVALLAAGCYAPKLQDGQFTCAQGGSCPIGFSCNACGVCTRSPATSCDMGAAHDLGGGSAQPCTNGGARAPNDPGLPTVAACPAAWATPGLATAPACNRQPTANGKSASGASCAAADNCAAGWHLCRDDADLTAHGFSAASCSALASAQALFVTLQPGAPPMPDGGMPMGPPQCGGTEEHVVFGCGGLANPPDSATCTIENRAIVDKPNDGVDDCATLTQGAFSCGATGVVNPQVELTAIIKPALAGGGVLCCAD